MLKAVLLDLDGTLLDTPRAIVDIAQETMAALGRAPVSEEVLREGIGLPLNVALATAMRERVGAPIVEEARAIYSRLWRAQVTPRLKALLFPGVLDGIQKLRLAGLRLAVVTGKAQEGADSTVDGAGLRPYIEHVLGYTAVKNPKPAPDLALLALDRLRLPPEAAAMVGDATHDILMARAAGVRSIAVTNGAQPESLLRAANPDTIVPTFREAVPILLGLAEVEAP